MNDIKQIFSTRLISLREENNISQQELADKLGITRQSLSLYEKVERTINIELLAKIADFFNVSTDYLMGRTDTTTMNKDIQTSIHHPSHYQGKHECIDEMITMFGIEAVKGFCKCNAYKYRYRAGKKDGQSYEQDIAKADWYIDYLMKLEEKI